MKDLVARMLNSGLAPITAESVEASRQANEASDRLFVAAGHGADLALALRLLRERPELIGARNGMGRTPLAEALRWGNDEIAMALIPQSDLSAVDEKGATLLMAAAQSAGDGVAAALLETGDPDAATPSGETAWVLAAKNGRDALLGFFGAVPVRGEEGRAARERNVQAALETAAGLSHWRCADALALLMSLARARGVVSGIGAERLPRAAAKVEAADLAGVAGLGAAPGALAGPQGLSPQSGSPSPRRL